MTDQEAKADRTRPDVKEILARWRSWAVTAVASAHHERTERGDEFAASLIDARRCVRLRAIAMLGCSTDLHATAERMHRQAIELHVPKSSPLIGFDPVAIRYTQARAWQACARGLNPDLPEVQIRWD